MDYNQTLDYIYSFVDYGLKSRYKYSPETFDLTRMRTLLARLGDPQRRLPAVHVAGTKGKGSVSAMTASILQAAGFKVGLYTSPHLNDFCERLQFNGQWISHNELAALTTEIRPVIDSMPGVTTFEITTALANVWFARQGAEFAVFEVGLGGRLDATNVLYPNVCAITSISYDHMQLLGKTLPEIAEEKSGIIKPGVPVISAPQDDAALQKIATIARERGARLRQVGHDWQFDRQSFAGNKQSFSMQPSPELLEQIGTWEQTQFEIPLLGVHQVENACVAIAMMQELREQGFSIPMTAITSGLAHVLWPGRFEVIAHSGKTFILDCAHNHDSMMKLTATLAEQFPNAKPVLIFGASEDKDISGMLKELVVTVSQVLIAKADHPRASNTEQLSTMVSSVAEQCGVALSVNVAHTVNEALQAAKNSDDPFVLVTGSIFLVADIRALLLDPANTSPH